MEESGVLGGTRAQDLDMKRIEMEWNAMSG